MSKIAVLQFTDMLCVWAYACQVRIDHLLEKSGEHIALEPRFCSVFGNARGNLQQRWADRGGLEGYAAHVRGVCDKFDHVAINDKTWSVVAPRSSINSHIFLAAIRNLEQHEQVEAGSFGRACWAFREAFFRDARDIGLRTTHYEIAEGMSLPIQSIEQCLGTGAAHADLAKDLDLARTYDVRVSPTLVLNDGRQRLTGNVGFRVIEANVLELLRDRGQDDASWC